MVGYLARKSIVRRVMVGSKCGGLPISLTLDNIFRMKTAIKKKPAITLNYEQDRPRTRLDGREVFLRG